MKYLLVLLLTYTSPVIGQSLSHTLKLNDTAMNTASDSMQAVKLFIIDHKLLDSLIKTPNKRFKICIFLEYGCWSCKEKLPYLINYLQANQNMFDVYLISLSPYEKEQTVLAFVHQVLHFKGKVFVLNEKQYRTKKWSNYKLNRLLKELLPKGLCLECNRKKIGYSDFILFDQTGNPIYSSSYENDVATGIQDLKDIVASPSLQ